jgi:uncharacterized protein (TIGR02145 family)
MPETGEITLAVAEAKTGEPAIFTGVEASLQLKLVNKTGSDVALADGSRPATFTVYLPVPKFFTAAELARMEVTADGWRGSVDTTNLTIDIVCTQAGTWARGETLVFVVDHVQSDASPATDNVYVEPSNMANVQLSVDTPFAVTTPPVEGNLHLADVLQVSLDSQGLIYRSDADDPLASKLLLTIKNVGATALGTDAKKLWGSPEVSVSFVYGNTSGALAPDTRPAPRPLAKGVEASTPPVGSAWNIKVGAGPLQRSWEFTNPRIDGQEEHPKWLLSPTATNAEILGPAGTDGANVTFVFSPVVSLTPPGHTQMLVLFSGFAKDEHTHYDSHLVVLDIVKQDPPPTRGLVSFFGTDPVIDVIRPKESVSVPLRWTTFGVAKVQLFTSSPLLPPMTWTHTELEPLVYSETNLTLPPLHSSEAIFMTLQAFDGRGGYLNSLQFTTYAQVAYIEDAGGHVYRIALIGNTFWMMENYRYATAQGSYAYQDDPRLVPTYGRLYDFAAAQASIPDGWQLPTADDWKTLIQEFGGEHDAYVPLLAGGRVGFDGQLGGERVLQIDGRGQYQRMYSYGYYWTAEGQVYAQFSHLSKSVSVGSIAPEGAALSVRYIRRA